MERGPGRSRRYKGALYRLYVALLWDYVHGSDRLRLLDRLEEPELGRPISFEYRGRRISEDLCNSVLEALSVTDALPAPLGRDTVIELGSGYGRLAWVFLEAFPRSATCSSTYRRRWRSRRSNCRGCFRTGGSSASGTSTRTTRCR